MKGKKEKRYISTLVQLVLKQSNKVERRGDKNQKQGEHQCVCSLLQRVVDHRRLSFVE